MPDLSPLRQAVSGLRPVFKTPGHDPHPNWGDEGHDPDPQLGVWFTSPDAAGRRVATSPLGTRPPRQGQCFSLGAEGRGRVLIPE